MRVWLSLVLLLAAGAPAAAQTVTARPATTGTGTAPAPESKTVLVLHSYGYDTPGRLVFDAALARTMREAADANIDLYVETIDSNRFRGEAQLHRTRSFLRERYADKRIAVVVAVYERALAFLLDTDDPLFAGIPVAALLPGNPHTLPARVSAVWSGLTYGQTAAMALRLHPDTRQIALIDAAQPGEAGETVYAEALKQVVAAAPQATIVPLRNLPLEALLPRVQKLPPGTIALLIRQRLGQKGAAITNQAAVSEIARVAPVPVYVSGDRLIGSGAVGGLVVSLERQAENVAGLALQMARDSTLRAPTTSTPAVPTFDERQLRRWGLEEARLPEGSVVLFRQPSPWRQYRSYFIGGIAIVLMQALLISGLVIQGFRRRRTDVALRESENQFRVMAEANRDLAGRLIHAQEAERTRIARDLHDDLSQQLAGIAIMLSGLKRRLGRASADADIDLTVSTLQERTATIAEAVRNLSHELHPSVLEPTGLEATLRRLCDDVERHHQLQVTLTTAGDFNSLTSGVALCLFRVTQEALGNIVRHAQATSVDVGLTVDADRVGLSVTDNGVGFVTTDRARHGLGLRSMDERVRLAKGTVTVKSAPGRGSSVIVQIPIAA